MHHHTSMATTSKPPHIVLVLVDDLGFNGVGFRNNVLRTPAIDDAARTGVILDSFYTAPLCGPSRASLLTGRMPDKLQSSVDNLAVCWLEEGIDTSYTLLPELLRQRFNYATFMVGKWHGGFSHPAYLPTNRGFDSFFGFLGGCEDHVTQRTCNAACGSAVGAPVDLYRDGAPAIGENGTDSGFSHNCLRWGAAAVDIIQRHARGNSRGSDEKPLFLFASLQDPHAPYQTPPRFEAIYRQVEQPLRRTWYGMISAIDETLDNITGALRQEGLWSTTLLIFASDNGSPVCGWGAGGSNHPLRGGKGSYWEGGIRTPAIVNGGWLPKRARGRHLNGLVHICDIYATLCAAANGGKGCELDGQQRREPARSDSLNMLPYIFGGAAASPRTRIVHLIGLVTYRRRADDQSWELAPKSVWHRPAGVLRSGDFKLIVGSHDQASWFGAFSPALNASALAILSAAEQASVASGRQKSVHARLRQVRRQVYAQHVANQQRSACSELEPCLFDVASDPEERLDLAKALPSKLEELTAILEGERRTWDGLGLRLHWAPANRSAWCAAAAANDGFMVPWQREATSHEHDYALESG